jgi:hypothetical protein
METNMTNSYKVTKTRHKYANRYKMISEDGARGECELMDDGTYRLRFGSMIGSTKYASMDDVAQEAFRCSREALARISVV